MVGPFSAALTVRAGTTVRLEKTLRVLSPRESLPRYRWHPRRPSRLPPAPPECPDGCRHSHQHGKSTARARAKTRTGERGKNKGVGGRQSARCGVVLPCPQLPCPQTATPGCRKPPTASRWKRNQTCGVRSQKHGSKNPSYLGGYQRGECLDATGLLSCTTTQAFLGIHSAK